MSQDLIVRQDIASLLDGWIQAERSGVEFPVPLHDYWNIAGHKKTQDAFKLLESRQEDGFDYLRSTVNSAGGGSGRKRQARFLTVAALERLCLAAHTTEGDAIRELYRQSKAKWDLTKQVAPEIAQEVEIIHLKIELAKIEAQKAALEDKTLSLRHYVVSALPKATADRILGVTEIAGETKVQTVVVNEYGQILDAGNTITKSKLAERYGFVSRTGKPDTKLVSDLIEEAIMRGAISDPWKDSRVVAAPGFDANLVPVLDRFHQANPVQRQRWMGEN